MISIAPVVSFLSPILGLVNALVGCWGSSFVILGYVGWARVWHQDDLVLQTFFRCKLNAFV